MNYSPSNDNSENKQLLFNQYVVQICISKPHIAHRASFRHESYINDIPIALAKEIAIFGSRANANTPQYTID